MSTISITQVAATQVAHEGGRHRLGRPGLIAVGSLGIVVRHGLLSWFRSGRHRWTAPRAAAGRPVAGAVPASV